jgi:vacuolar-type H+-ATPase subunit E/Vma4
MNLDEKINFFTRTIQSDAIEKKDRILEQNQIQFSDARKKAEKEAQRAASVWIQEEKARISQANNQTMAQVSAEGKKELAELRSKLAAQALADVEKRLRIFAMSDGYGPELLRRVTEALGSRQNVRVQVMRRDKVHIEGKLPKGVGLDSADEGDFIGGFKLFLDDKNAIIDNTFAGGLRDERENFSLRELLEQRGEIAGQARNDDDEARNDDDEARNDIQGTPEVE